MWRLKATHSLNFGLVGVGRAIVLWEPLVHQLFPDHYVPASKPLSHSYEIFCIKGLAFPKREEYEGKGWSR